ARAHEGRHHHPLPARRPRHRHDPGLPWPRGGHARLSNPRASPAEGLHLGRAHRRGDAGARRDLPDGGSLRKPAPHDPHPEPDHPRVEAAGRARRRCGAEDVLAGRRRPVRPRHDPLQAERGGARSRLGRRAARHPRPFAAGEGQGDVGRHGARTGARGGEVRSHGRRRRPRRERRREAAACLRRDSVRRARGRARPGPPRLDPAHRRLDGREALPVEARRALRRRLRGGAEGARAARAGHVPARGERARPRGGGDGGRAVIGLARIGGPVAVFGLALLLLARTRRDRLAGLGFAALGACMLAASLAPHDYTEAVGGTFAGLAVAAVLAAAFRREPWLLPILALASIPVRIGWLHHHLLVPLYVVVLAAAMQLAWEVAHGDVRARELRAITWPLALYLALVGLSLGWTESAHDGAIEVLAFYVPFTVLAVGIARLPWKRLGLWALYAELTLMALVFSVVGFYQYETRNVFENPKVIYSNAYAAFFRVNSVFWDPSVYGRFLVVAMIPSVVLIARGRSLRVAGAAAAALLVIWFGLLISFSQSSFAALVVAVIAVAFVAWRWKALFAVGLAVIVLGGLAVAQPTVRRSFEHHTKSGLNSASSGRYNLVANGIRIAIAHPVRGVGVGGFEHAYARR